MRSLEEEAWPRLIAGYCGDRVCLFVGSLLITYNSTLSSLLDKMFPSSPNSPSASLHLTLGSLLLYVLSDLLFGMLKTSGNAPTLLLICPRSSLCATNTMQARPGIQKTVLLQSCFCVFWQSQASLANHQQTSSPKIFVTFTVDHFRYLARGLLRLSSRTKYPRFVFLLPVILPRDHDISRLALSSKNICRFLFFHTCF